jgi:hypothetical protein
LSLLIIKFTSLSPVIITFIVLNYCHSLFWHLIYFLPFIRHSTTLRVSELHQCVYSSKRSEYGIHGLRYM